MRYEGFAPELFDQFLRERSETATQVVKTKQNKCQQDVKKSVRQKTDSKIDRAPDRQTE